MVASAAPLAWPANSIRASFPADGAAKSLFVPVKAFQVENTTTLADINTQVLDAIKVWQTKIPGLLFDWSSTASSVVACDPSFTSDCATEPKTHLDSYDDNSQACVPTIGWYALTLRFPNGPTLPNGQPNTGVQFLFTNSIFLDPSAPGTPLETVPFYSPSVCSSQGIAAAAGNMSVMSNQTSGHVAAHSMGHIFGLLDLDGDQAAGPPEGGGSNLMCSGDSHCTPTSTLGTFLTYPQVMKAQKEIVKWTLNSH
jgi:hypothetical protein